MLSAIKDIGDFAAEETITSDRQKGAKIISIVLNLTKLSFGIELEDFDIKKLALYLFKPGASKGNAPAPFSPLNRTAAEKTYRKIEKWLNNCNKTKGIRDTDKAFLDNVEKLLDDSRAQIVEALKSKVHDLPKRRGESLYLTLKFEAAKEYLGEYDVFTTCSKELTEAKFKMSAGENQVCSVCGLTKAEVSGKTGVYKFYTIDKPGFIAGGLKEDIAWRNFPVCEECKTALERGKAFVEAKLSFRFHGLNYYLIPRLLVGRQDALEEILSVLSDTTKSINLKKSIKKRITDDENEILDYLAQKSDTIALNFLFLRREQSAERILLLIEDVLPSRLSRLFIAKDYVDGIFNDDFNFYKLREFFSKSDEAKREYDLTKYFLAVIESVFKGQLQDYLFLLKFFMSSIRKEFIKDRYFNFRVKDALMDTVFLEYLGLITFEEAVMEESVFDGVFDRYGGSFKTPAKRGIFLLGALTQLLLNKQWSDRKAKPFMKKLKGLKMSEKDLKALLPDVQNKLEEYDSFDKGKRKIATEASKYILEAGEAWKMPVDEINFYFACGMNLVDQVAEVVYKKEAATKEEE